MNINHEVTKDTKTQIAYAPEATWKTTWISAEFQCSCNETRNKALRHLNPMGCLVAFVPFVPSWLEIALVSEIVKVEINHKDTKDTKNTFETFRQTAGISVVFNVPTLKQGSNFVL
jgi:hypothetical protein